MRRLERALPSLVRDRTEAAVVLVVDRSLAPSAATGSLRAGRRLCLVSCGVLRFPAEARPDPPHRLVRSGPLVHGSPPVGDLPALTGLVQVT